MIELQVCHEICLDLALIGRGWLVELFERRARDSDRDTMNEEKRLTKIGSRFMLTN